MTTPDTTNNPRALAEERLSHLSSLQMRMQRRGGPGHGPVRDGRGGQGRVLSLLAMNPEISQRESREGRFVSITVTAVFPSEKVLQAVCANIAALDSFVTMF